MGSKDRGFFLALYLRSIAFFYYLWNSTEARDKVRRFRPCGLLRFTLQNCTELKCYNWNNKLQLLPIVLVLRTYCSKYLQLLCIYHNWNTVIS